jgi:hypothetical protein
MNLCKMLVSTLIALHARTATTVHKSPDGRQKVNHAQIVFQQLTPIDNQKLSSTGIDATYLNSLCLSPKDRCTSAAPYRSSTIFGSSSLTQVGW